MPTKLIKNSYNAGELSQYMDGRTDINKYYNGCSKLINALVLPHGGVVKRPGTEYIATAPNQCKLFPFEFSVDDALILEFSRRLLRFYKDQDIVNEKVGTEDISGLGNIIAHWLLNEDLGTIVVDDDGATHNGTATVSCSTLHADGKVGTGCFDLDGQYTVEVNDSDDFTFSTADANDDPFSIACWANVTNKGGLQVLLSKWRGAALTREWRFSLTNDRKLQLHLADISVDLSGDVVCQWKLNDDAADTNVISSAPTYTIDDADAGANTFTISDDGDLSSSFPDNSEFTVAGSTGNDGQYSVSSTAYSAPDFVITVAAVADGTDDGTIAPHAGVASANTDTFNATGKINGALDFGGSKYVAIDDSADFSFGNGTSDSPFSINSWAYIPADQFQLDTIIGKGHSDDSDGEWLFGVQNFKPYFFLYDQSANAALRVRASTAISSGWHMLTITYDGSSTVGGITLYVDNETIVVSDISNGTYVAMENLGSGISIGSTHTDSSAEAWEDKIDNVVLFDIELTRGNIHSLWNDSNGTESLIGTAPLPFAVSDDVLLTGWHFLSCTYSAPADETTAADGIILYVDGVTVASTATNNASYTAMQNGTEEVRIGSQRNSGDSANENFWEDKIDEVSIFSDVLTPTEVASLYSTTPYSIATPYFSAGAFDIHTTQSADVMYIAHKDIHPQKLSRFGDLNWTMVDVPFTGGPFLSENITAASLVQFARLGGTAESGYYFPTGATGTLTATGTGNQPFNSNMVGALWLVKHTRDVDNDTDTFAKDTNVVPTLTTYASGAISIKGAATVTFEPIATGKMAQLWRKEGNGTWQTYRSFRGAVAFSWTEDRDDVLYAMTRSDNSINGTLTAKEEINRGVVKITAFTSATVVAVEVVDKVLTNGSGTSATTAMWAEGAWSDYRGYPRTVGFHEDRLWWWSSTNNPDTGWGSKTGNYESHEFTDTGLDDDAVIVILSGNEVSQAQWMMSRQVMAIGAANREYRLSAQNPDDPITPLDKKATPQTGFSSGNIQPVMLNDSIFFLQRQGKKLGAMRFDSITENFDVDDATLLAYGLLDSAPTTTAVSRSPDSTIWVTRTDGVMPTFTYEPKEEVVGWARQIFGNSAAVETATGYVESVAVIHGSTEDEIWVSVRRVINTATVYYVEKFKPRSWGSDIEDACYVDSAITYDSVSSTATVTAAHLKGETVSVFADGEVFDDAVANVSTGVVTLKKSGTATDASVVQYGLPYTMKARSMRLAVPQTPGALQTKIKRVKTVAIRYIRSLLGSAGVEYGGTEYLTDIEATYSTSSADTDPQNRATQGGYNEDTYTTILSDDPVPFTVLSAVTEVEI